MREAHFGDVGRINNEFASIGEDRFKFVHAFTAHPKVVVHSGCAGHDGVKGALFVRDVFASIEVSSTFPVEKFIPHCVQITCSNTTGARHMGHVFVRSDLFCERLAVISTSLKRIVESVFSSIIFGYSPETTVDVAFTARKSDGIDSDRFILV